MYDTKKYGWYYNFLRVFKNKSPQMIVMTY